MTLETAKYLHDVAAACDLVLRFTQGKTFADYESDAMMRAAVEREFILIGEAVSQALKREPAVGQAIRHTRQIVAFRNILVHGYASISDATVWGVVENDLTDLSQDVSDLLAQIPPERS